MRRARMGQPTTQSSTSATARALMAFDTSSTNLSTNHDRGACRRPNVPASNSPHHPCYYAASEALAEQERKVVRASPARQAPDQENRSVRHLARSHNRVAHDDGLAVGGGGS